VIGVLSNQHENVNQPALVTDLLLSRPSENFKYGFGVQHRREFTPNYKSWNSKHYNDWTVSISVSFCVNGRNGGSKDLSDERACSLQIASHQFRGGDKRENKNFDIVVPSYPCHCANLHAL
jgi:hypothetical protein